MNPERQVQQALRALAEHDRDREAPTPASVIFARRSRGSHWRVWAGFAAAAGLLFLLWPAERVSDPPPAIVSMAEPIVEKQMAPPPAAAPKPKPVRRTKRSAPEPLEVVTDFYPLMDAPPPFERGRLLRVVVPASTMHSVGLPINPDRWSERVQADVLVGEEGMARAIRFVSYEQ